MEYEVYLRREVFGFLRQCRRDDRRVLFGGYSDHATS